MGICSSTEYLVSASILWQVDRPLSSEGVGGLGAIFALHNIAGEGPIMIKIIASH